MPVPVSNTLEYMRVVCSKRDHYFLLFAVHGGGREMFFFIWGRFLLSPQNCVKKNVMYVGRFNVKVQWGFRVDPNVSLTVSSI